MRRHGFHRTVAQSQNHEQTRMALESLIEERPRDASGFVRQQLSFDTVNSRRLLQGLDHVRQQLYFDFASVWNAAAVGDEKIADHSLTSFIYEKAVAKNAAAIDGSISRKNFRVDIAQNHLGRSVVVPGKQAGPDMSLVVQQGTQVDG